MEVVSISRKLNYVKKLIMIYKIISLNPEKKHSSRDNSSPFPT